MTENVVETRNLTKVYRDFWGRKKKTALNALDLTIQKGEIFGLLGPNGSGKTTTIKLLLGLLFPSSGEALVFNQPAAKVEKNERIGLAQALINDPDLVILDEPTSGLDPLGTRWMKDLILDLKKKGKTILMCSHRLDDVQDVCDRIAILFNGDLQEQGAVNKLVEDQKRLQLQASGVELNADLERELKAVIEKHGGKLEAVGHPTTTLEDLFLRIIEESKARPGRRYLPTDGAK